MVPATVIRAPAGLGKTKAVIEQIKTSTGFVEIYVPTRALALELVKDFQLSSSTTYAAVIEGRSQPDANGQPLCSKSVLAEQLGQAGLPVYSTLCRTSYGNKAVYCPHYSTCGYNRQFRGINLRIYPHAYLPLERSRLDANHPDIAIIDESFFQACISVEKLSPAALMQAATIFPDDGILNLVASTLQQNQPLLDALRGKALAKLRKKIEQDAKRMFDPNSSSSLSRQKLAQAKQWVLTARMLAALELERQHRTGHSQTVALTSAGDIAVHTLKPITRFDDQHTHKGIRQTKVLIIDADADKDIIGQFFAVQSFSSVPATRKARVIQCTDKASGSHRYTRCSILRTA